MHLVHPFPQLASTVRANPLALAVALAMATLALPASAGVIETDTPGLKITWDNVAKYSAAFRVASPQQALLANPNADDGDRNFSRGLISNRVDLLSELDIQYQDIGARLSGAAWYDDVYNRSNDNPGFGGGAFPNHRSTSYNQFTRATRDLHGRKAELLDAFVFGRFHVGEMRTLVRAGRHAMVWGESLFFGANAIAGGMAPVDITKLLSVPGTQFKEAIRPVPQVSGQIQLSAEVTLGAYYQFRFEPNRLPAVGSYFSQIDTNVDGGENILLGPAGVAARRPDQRPKDSGQGGLQLRIRHADTDYGLYAIRFHDKSQQLVTNLINLTPGGRPTLLPGSYHVAYQQGITAYGASASRTFGAANLAIEASVRRNQDLASAGHAADFSAAFGAPATNVTGNPAYAVGRTAHVNLSTLWSLDPNPLFSEGVVVGELAWNRVLSCQVNCAVFNPLTQQGTIDNNATRDAVALRVLLEPKYRQIMSGVDISVPLGFGYTPRGSRSMALGAGPLPPDGGGDLSIGLNGSYLDSWQFSLAYTRYFGRAATFLDNSNSFSYGQSLRDRDFVAFSLRRTL